jgi:hypothetical protein
MGREEAKDSDNFWSKVYSKSDNIVCRKIMDETILVPIRGNLADMQRIYTLNPIGAFIWDRLDGVNELVETRNDVLAHFAADREEVEADIVAFITQVREAGLIKEKTE